MNKLFYGDNLDVMRKFIRDETVDLCYIDPPFPTAITTRNTTTPAPKTAHRDRRLPTPGHGTTTPTFVTKKS